MNAQTLVRKLTDESLELQRIRRHMHAHPELSGQEDATAELVASKLKSWGLEVVTGIGGAGVVGVLKHGTSSRVIGLRADMDALPVHEASEFEHRSTRVGVMHACGHDGHVAMLLGAAKHLAANRQFDGSVVFIFQPAEESAKGARAMIDDGLFERFDIDAVFGLHNWPPLEAGSFGTRAGAIMASSTNFRITIAGEGGHGALPHEARDPVFATLQIAQALQGIITRNMSALDPAVLSITQMQGGSVSSVIPREAWIGGTIRTFENRTLAMIEKRIEEIGHGIARACQCMASISLDRACVPTTNSPLETALAVAVMQELVDGPNVFADVPPSMTGEDFGYMLLERPGNYAFIGNSLDRKAAQQSGSPCLLHSPTYDFNDAILPLGTAYWVRLVERFLREV